MFVAQKLNNLASESILWILFTRQSCHGWHVQEMTFGWYLEAEAINLVVRRDVSGAILRPENYMTLFMETSIYSSL